MEEPEARPGLRIRPKETVVPLCPSCDGQLAELFVRVSQIGPLRNLIYVCPHCSRVMGVVACEEPSLPVQAPPAKAELAAENRPSKTGYGADEWDLLYNYRLLPAGERVRVLNNLRRLTKLVQQEQLRKSGNGRP